MHGTRLDELSSVHANMNRGLDTSILSSKELLRMLGQPDEPVETSASEHEDIPIGRCLPLRSWNEIAAEADEAVKSDVLIEDILTAGEIESALAHYHEINDAFARRTRLNRLDMPFLLVATALQVVRSLVVPQIGSSIDSSSRMKHDDKRIKAREKERKRYYINRRTGGPDGEQPQVKESRKGYRSWAEIIVSSVPYDAIAGSANIGINMEGGYHRYKTLGHDPLLGWVFGTANIVTETISLLSLQTHRVKRMALTSETLSLLQLFNETSDSVDEDFHRLPAAVFRQGMHLASDQYTKLGLPVPLLGLFSEELAGKLYRSQYDALCLLRDAKIVGLSAVVASLINMVIGLVHGLFYDEARDSSRDLYEVRTRKILLVSNCIASSSSILKAYVTKNVKALDYGGLLVTLTRLFSDIRFITGLKAEFIGQQLDIGLQAELDEAERLYHCQSMGPESEFNR